MAQASAGDIVRVHYTGKMADGTVFDTSREREPLEFTLDEGRVIPGFEEAVRGMEPGEEKTVEIPPEQAYGPRSDAAIIEVDRNQVPENLEPKVGQQFQLQGAGGQVFPATVTKVSDKSVTLDANHPLAGETLIFDIELVEIV